MRAKKVTKETLRQGASRRAAHAGALRSSARRGTVRELAALRHPHLFALAGPAVLGSLKADPRSNATAAPSTSSRRGMLLFLILILTFQSALSEPSIAGESGAKRRRCLSAASSAPSPDSPRSAGYRRVATARAPAACFFGYFLCTSKESDTPPRSRK
ncbi:unnamed protein product [Stenotrophomonas maltophilia]|nr:unnamed protein product [Stenotrophomonas maltophilia]